MRALQGLCSLLILLFLSLLIAAQEPGGLNKTWKGPDMASIRQVLAENSTGAKPSAPKAGIKFVPAGDSGVAKSLAEAFAQNASQKATLTDAFSQIIAGIDAEMAKVKRSNDLAAAMTFFIAANVAAYHKTEIMSDTASEELYASVAASMNSSPQFTSLSNAEKHQLHDWLTAMGGFALSTYEDAKKAADREGMATASELAGYSMRLALGIDMNQMSAAGKLSSSAAVAAKPVGNSPVIGVWTAASSSPAGTSMVTNAGSIRARYTFNPDGTYQFKSERWGGYMSSNTWWTTEESGNYSISGTTLTVTPKSSKATLRNSAGAVQQTKNNPLETVSYLWKTHYFEGIRETNLVLEPPQKTSRDGVMGGSSLYPKAYLYKQGDALEWRY